jgi:hypothetical protein
MINYFFCLKVFQLFKVLKVFFRVFKIFKVFKITKVPVVSLRVYQIKNKENTINCHIFI